MNDPFQAWVVRENLRAERSGLPLGGVKLGVKDIIDVAGFPTSYGVTFATTQPAHDAWCVAALRAAGAIPVGKTQTTPFAFRDPAPTFNPRDPARTPGGSSAGSAVAVATGDVPLALGTQTIGSVLRPAAYCGVVGYKPTWGRIPTAGVAPNAPSLDTIGFFARDVAIVRRAAETLLALDDPVPSSLRVGVALDYMQAIIEPGTRAAIERAVARLREGGLKVPSATVARAIEESLPHGKIVQTYEAWTALGAWLTGKPVPPYLAQMLIDGRAVDLATYHASRAWREAQRPRVAEIFRGCDALIVPAANLAPDRSTTGDPTPLAPWTFFGLPAIALPIGDDPATGLPFSMQVVAPFGADGRLLSVAARIQTILLRTATGPSEGGS